MFVVRTVLIVISVVAIIASALNAAGAWFPSIPYLGSRGSSAITHYTVYMVAVPLLASIVLASFGGWRRGAGKVLITAGAVSTVLSLAGAARMVAVAWQNDVTVSLLPLLDPVAIVRTPVSTIRDSVTDNNGKQLDFAIYPPAGGAGDAPVLAYIHGGGFTGGSYLTRGDDLGWFADQGFLVISLEYGLSTQDDHRWDRTLGEIGCALAWIRSNAQRWGGDGKRIAVLGESAGGNLALNAGYRRADGTLPVSCDGEAAQVAAIGAIYPVISVADFHDNPHFEYAPASRRMASFYTGGTPREYPERYASLDPVQYLTPEAPPALVLHGTNDSTVQIDAANYWFENARRVGAPARLITLPLAEHAFDKRASISNQIMRQTMRDLFRDQLR
ncbi:hypothetical protein GCM10009127_10090 [Alteraurantiacibacter aestuarii]